MYLKSENIFFPHQIKRSGYLKIEEGKIAGYFPEVSSDAQVIDYGQAYLIPGFIDQHIHGWGTGSFNNDKSVHSINEMKKNLPYEGVTSFLATSGAEPIEDLLEGIVHVKEVLETQKDDGATCLGVHLEGPFINKEFKGMQREDCCIDPDMSIMQQFLEAQGNRQVIRLMTLAPELPQAKECITCCKENNIQINIGHSAATFDCIAQLKEFGLDGVTHMFSGMRGLHHRELGVAGAAMYFDDLMCEFAKQTGMTVKPEAFSIVYQVKGPDKIIMTTDCGGMALTKKEKYHYIRKQTFIPDPAHHQLILRNDDGSEMIVDTTDYKHVRNLELSYIKSIRNLIKNVHPSIHDIMKITAENPARYLGISDHKGSLEQGKDADILVVNENFDILAVYCMGKSYCEEEFG